MLYSNDILSQTREEDIKKDKILSLAICSLLFHEPIIFFINIVFNFFVRDFIYDTLVSYIALIVILFYALYKCSNKIKFDAAFVFLILMIGYLLSPFINSDNTKYMFTNLKDFSYNPFYGLFIFSFPAYFLIRHLKDFKIFKRMILIFSWIVVIALNSIFMLNFYGIKIDIQYMVFSYQILTPTCFLINDFFENRNKISFCFAILSTITIFVAGARGTVLCLLGYLFLVFIYNARRNIKKVILLIIIASIVVPYVSINFNSKLTSLNMYLQSRNISSRTISLILQERVTSDSGRNLIKEKLLDDLENSFLIGNGMFGDRVVAQGTLTGTDVATYAHNIVLEFLSQYGVIFGSFSLIVIFGSIICSLLVPKDEIIKNMILTFIPAGIIKLFLSGSYLNEPFFYVVMGLSISALLRHNAPRRANMKNRNHITKNKVDNDDYLLEY